MSDARKLQEMRTAQARRNKEPITRYYDQALNKKDFAAARSSSGRRPTSRTCTWTSSARLPTATMC